MKDEKAKLSLLDEIFLQFSEKNRNNLLKTANRLLKVQQDDAEMLADIPISVEKVKEEME